MADVVIVATVGNCRICVACCWLSVCACECVHLPLLGILLPDFECGSRVWPAPPSLSPIGYAEIGFIRFGYFFSFRPSCLASCQWGRGRGTGGMTHDWIDRSSEPHSSMSMAMLMDLSTPQNCRRLAETHKMLQQLTKEFGAGFVASFAYPSGN